MMKKDLRVLWILFLFVSICTMFSSSTLGQETTGSIEVTVVDAAGAVVPNVSITVASAGGTGFKRTATTSDSGFTRILQVPPGIYVVTAAATAGFVEKNITEVSVGL